MGENKSKKCFISYVYSVLYIHIDWQIKNIVLICFQLKEKLLTSVEIFQFNLEHLFVEKNDVLR